MKAITLMYHDVVERGRPDSSGFPGADAALYKLAVEQFSGHLAAIAAATPLRPTRVTDRQHTGDAPLYLTFDDGGASAYTTIAGELEERGWRGHFFITGAAVGTPAFLSPAQIRELDSRGHVLGSHSWSHPVRMAYRARAVLVEEWRRSVDLLSDMLGRRVTTASVPGGYYSRRVAEAAEEAGIELLFTSEPVTRSWKVGSCDVFGRYTIQERTPAAVAARLAAGRRTPQLRQLLLWNVKKVSKQLGGEYYLKARRNLLGVGARRQ